MYLENILIKKTTSQANIGIVSVSKLQQIEFE